MIGVSSVFLPWWIGGHAGSDVTLHVFCWCVRKGISVMRVHCFQHCVFSSVYQSQGSSSISTHYCSLGIASCSPCISYLEIFVSQLRLSIQRIVRCECRRYLSCPPPPPRKLEAHATLQAPTDIAKLRRAPGMFTFLTKFLPEMATISAFSAAPAEIQQCLAVD